MTERQSEMSVEEEARRLSQAIAIRLGVDFDKAWGVYRGLEEQITIPIFRRARDAEEQARHVNGDSFASLRALRDEVAALRAELEAKDKKLAELEKELVEAREAYRLQTGDMYAAGEKLEAAERERDAFKADLARVSEEMGLPSSIGPAPGELRRILECGKRAEKERDEARLVYLACFSEKEAAEARVHEVEQDELGWIRTATDLKSRLEVAEAQVRELRAALEEMSADGPRSPQAFLQAKALLARTESPKEPKP